MSDFLALDTLVLDPRFNGPPGTANGGYACGAIGELVDGPAEVTLRTPPPLGVPLDVEFLGGGGIDVHDRVALVMSARPVAGVDVEPPARPTLAEAREATRRHPGHGRDGLLSGCYVCGSCRYDGLGIHFAWSASRWWRRGGMWRPRDASTTRPRLCWPRTAGCWRAPWRCGSRCGNG